MRNFGSLLEREVEVEQPPPQQDEETLKATGSSKSPKRAALLSLVPGVGQLYNGEISKGTLFLVVTAANFSILLCVLNLQTVLAVIGQIAGAQGLQLHLESMNSIFNTYSAKVAAGVYASLILTFVTYSVKDAYDTASRKQQGVKFAKFFMGLPEVTSGSYLVHYAVMLAMLITIVLVVVPKPPQENVIEMELIQPEPPPPVPEPPKPEPVKTPPKPVEETPKPKPTPRPVETKQIITPAPDLPIVENSPISAPTPEPPAATQPSGDGAPGTGGGAPSTGGGGGDGQDVDFSNYMAEMEKKIRKAWFPPKGNESKRVKVKFKLNSQGAVQSVRMVTSSGIAIVDEAATAAIQNASPFGDLPKGSPDVVEIKFTFDYNVFGGQMKM